MSVCPLDPHSSNCGDVCALYAPFLHQLTMQSSLFGPGCPVLVVVCVARKLRLCPSYSRRRDRINLGLWRSLYKGGGGYSEQGGTKVPVQENKGVALSEFRRANTQRRCFSALSFAPMPKLQSLPVLHNLSVSVCRRFLTFVYGVCHWQCVLVCVTQMFLAYRCVSVCLRVSICCANSFVQTSCAPNVCYRICSAPVCRVMTIFKPRVMGLVTNLPVI